MTMKAFKLERIIYGAQKSILFRETSASSQSHDSQERQHSGAMCKNIPHFVD